MSHSKAKILPLSVLKEIRGQLKATHLTVVQCHGCFDIVHPGHIRYLRFAKEQGDILIVSLTADKMMSKGFDRPYINQDLRAENLAALECVDYVCVDESEWGGPILDALKPDIYVKGKEYETSSHPGFLKEKALVEAYGGRVIFSSGEVVYSSSFIISQFRERFNLEQERIHFFCRQHQITVQRLDSLLTRAATKKVLVIGDPILDHYVHCDVLGVAAESPMLSVTPVNDAWYIGAGGLVAKQFAAFGAGAGFLTMLGGNDDAFRFREGLQKGGVELIGLEVEDRPTYTKTRYLVDENKVFKVDTGRHAPLSTVATHAVIDALDQHLPEYDALVVIDFGYGFFTEELIDAIPRLVESHQKRYYVDVSHTRRASILRFKRPRLATPTEHEIRFALADNESGLSNLASRYYRETGAENLILTMGKRGVLIFSPPEEGAKRLRTDYLPAFSARAADAVGAGDVFHTSAVLADLGDEGVAVGGYLGSCIAALHINQVGNEPVSLLDARDYFHHREELR